MLIYIFINEWYKQIPRKPQVTILNRKARITIDTSDKDKIEENKEDLLL